MNGQYAGKHESGSTSPPPSTEPASPPARRGIVFRISSAIDNALRSAFFRFGLFVATNPIKVIIVTIIFMVATLTGMLRFHTESRAEKLWVPGGTTALQNKQFVDKYYERLYRFTAIVFRSKNSDESLATREAFLEMLKVAESGFNVEAPAVESDDIVADGPITFSERCFKTSDKNSNEICRTESPFSIFYNADLAVLRDDGKVDFFETVRRNIQSLSDEEISQRLLDPPATAFDGSPFNPDEMYAFSNDNPSILEVVRYTQLFDNNAVNKDGELIDVEADQLEEKWTKELLENLKRPGEKVEWYVSSAWGEGESLESALSSDLPLLSFGFLLLAVYVITFLGDFHSVRSHRLLAIAALVTTGLSLATCFGLSSAFGMFFGPVHQILPLLIIGIGIDDCFHITRAADEVALSPDHDRKSIPMKIALSLSQSGAAITVTSFTNVAVFLLSAISRLPALRFFALWAAIGIFFAWVYAITFYTAFVTLDMRRISANRLDCIPCIKRKEVKELNWFKKRPGGFSRFFGDWFGPFIMRTPVRIILLILFTAGLATSIYGCTQLYLKFRFSFFYPAGSAQREYQNVLDEYFKIGDPTYIYVRNNDMSKQENQEAFLRLCQPKGSIAQNVYIQDKSVDCWYANMLNTRPPANGPIYTPSEYITTVKSFISEDSPGRRYISDIVFNDTETEVISTRFSAQFKYRGSNREEIDSLVSVRKSAAVEEFGEVDGVPAAFPYTFGDTFTEQYEALPGEIGLSLGLASVAVAVVCLVLVGHPVVAFICVVVVGIIIIDVLGLTYYTDVNLNSVSVITLVLCTGIAVDFVVHIARAFLENIGTRTERAIKALAVMGPPVFYAGFSTFLAIIVLAGAQSYIFWVLFLGFFFLIILAFLHGLILGPILLSLVGPPSFYTDEVDKKNSERRLEERFFSEPKLNSDGQSNPEINESSEV